jgi:hypothetical protein
MHVAELREGAVELDARGRKHEGRVVEVPPTEVVMTLLWFLVWFICDRIGDREALRFDPVNWWVGTLLLALALDLGRQHAPRGARG